MRKGKYYMLVAIIWIVVAIVASAISAHGNESQPVPTLTMSATWAVATPTPVIDAPVIDAPVIMAYQFYLPFVKHTGSGE